MSVAYKNALILSSVLVWNRYWSILCLPYFFYYLLLASEFNFYICCMCALLLLLTLRRFVAVLTVRFVADVLNACAHAEERALLAVLREVRVLGIEHLALLAGVGLQSALSRRLACWSGAGSARLSVRVRTCSSSGRPVGGCPRTGRE